jgi:hypothetical protein
MATEQAMTKLLYRLMTMVISVLSGMLAAAEEQG